jgi:hypothetical protein
MEGELLTDVETKNFSVILKGALTKALVVLEIVVESLSD